MFPHTHPIEPIFLRWSIIHCLFPESSQPTIYLTSKQLVSKMKLVKKETLDQNANHQSKPTSAKFLLKAFDVKMMILGEFQKKIILGKVSKL